MTLQYRELCPPTLRPSGPPVSCWKFFCKEIGAFSLAAIPAPKGIILKGLRPDHHLRLDFYLARSIIPMTILVTF